MGKIPFPRLNPLKTMMKRDIVFPSLLCSLTVSAQQTPYQLLGAVRDAFTRESIRDVNLTLMTPDSVGIIKDKSIGSTLGCPNFTLTDIPEKRTNVRYSVNAQGQTGTYYNVMPRYAMFHVMYKLNREPKRNNL
ncbi:MAG: hypothetical protein LUC45_07735 [Paraprevotella sp.]|nr:hypothetical protein [Paraprevotella sp.]